MTKQRLWQLDALRGLALLNMLAYHAMYDWVYVFGHAGSWYNIGAPGCHVWQQYICWSFILLSGYSFTLARRPLKNGLIAAGCAAVLTVVTVGFMPSESIWFGVLHLNAAAVLLSCLIKPLLDKIPAVPGLIGSAMLFALTNQLPWGWLGFERWHIAALPAGWYDANLFWLGLPDLTRFSSADYFPILPWVFFVLVRAVSGAAVAAARGAGTGGAAAAVRDRRPDAAGLHAAPAGNLRHFVVVDVPAWLIVCGKTENLLKI